MYVELKARGLRVDTEVPIAVKYKGQIIGDYRADMIVEKIVIVELKAVERLLLIHHIQTVNYLTATGFDIGLLINFGGPRLEIARKFRLHTPTRV